MIPALARAARWSGAVAAASAAAQPTACADADASPIAGRRAGDRRRAQQPRPYPTFAQIPPLPTDVRPLAAWRAAVARR